MKFMFNCKCHCDKITYLLLRNNNKIFLKILLNIYTNEHCSLEKIFKVNYKFDVITIYGLLPFNILYWFQVLIADIILSLKAILIFLIKKQLFLSVW